jgi:hypothetical protein
MRPFPNMTFGRWVLLCAAALIGWVCIIWLADDAVVLLGHIHLTAHAAKTKSEPPPK